MFFTSERPRLTKCFSVALILLVLTLSLPAPAAPLILHVAPNGNDTWSGNLPVPNQSNADGPFATIERARDELRRLKAEDALPAGGAIVEVSGGRYELAEPIALTAEDSGTADAPIIYRANAGDTVRLSGGQLITGWKSVEDPAILKRLDPAARGKILQTDLKAQGIDEFGAFDYDPEWELQTRLARDHHQGEYVAGNARASANRDLAPRLELFFDNRPMQIARGPNEKELRIEEPLGERERNVRGHISRLEGIFRYEGDYPKRWVGETNAWLCGSWCRDWLDQRHRVESLDAEKRILTVPRPWHTGGYSKGQWFYGFNILAELDRPGEWYVDHEAGILYFWPPKPIDSAWVEVSMTSRLFTLNEVSHVTIQGFLFEAARATAVALHDCKACRVLGCTFRNLGAHAITIVDGGQCTISGCDMYENGGGGIYLVGGNRTTLTAARHEALNNHIHHFGRWENKYRPGIMISGVGNRVANNLIHDAPHSAILFGGNDHTIELNEIHNVCTEAHDCGAIYAGRSWTLRGHTIRYNYLHHLYGKFGGPCNGIYLDDLFSSALVEGNVFFQVWRPVFLGGGRDNTIQNNIFVDCPKAIHIDARALGWCGPHADGRIEEAREKGTIGGDRFNEPPFSTRYPQLAKLLNDEPKKPKGNIVRRNIFWKGAAENLRRVAKDRPVKDTWWDDITPSIRNLVKLENNLINVDPQFVDQDNEDFQLREDSPAWTMGFQKVPIERIGVIQDNTRASWPVVHQARTYSPK